MAFARSILRVLDGRMMPLSMWDSAAAVCTHSAQGRAQDSTGLLGKCFATGMGWICRDARSDHRVTVYDLETCTSAGCDKV